MTQRIDISWKTIVFLALFLLVLWITYQILDLILLLFVSLILMSALFPAVNFFTRLKIPKALAIVLVYLVVLTFLGGLVTLSFTPLINETSKLAPSLPPIINVIFRGSNIDQGIIQQEIGNLSRHLLSFTKTIVDNIITIIFLLVFTFYLLLERKELERRAASLFMGKEERIRRVLIEIEEKLGAWLRGQLFLSFLIGAFVYLGLTLLQIPFALSLAILAAFMEVIPVIGPIIAAIPAIILGLAISPLLGVGVAAFYFVLQQLENHIIVPQVMRKVVGLNPLVVILAIAVGGRLLGIGGALLAVPIVVVLQIVVIDILKERKI